MDTTKLANVAEDLIAHKLQRGGILVAKPKFDRLGADLLGLIEVSDGAKFCRIQCKGRSVRARGAHIEIPFSYVTPAFILVLYLEADDDTGPLYCFFESDMKTWTRNAEDEYKLSLPKSSYAAILKGNLFVPATVERIKQIIRKSNVAIEIGHLSGVASMRFSVPGTLTDASRADSRGS